MSEQNERDRFGRRNAQEEPDVEAHRFGRRNADEDVKDDSEKKDDEPDVEAHRCGPR